MKTAKTISEAEAYLTLAQRKMQQAEQELERMKEECRRTDTELTNREAARLLGVHEVTICRMKNDGRLKSTRIMDVLNYRKQKG